MIFRIFVLQAGKLRQVCGQSEHKRDSLSLRGYSISEKCTNMIAMHWYHMGLEDGNGLGQNVPEHMLDDTMKHVQGVLHRQASRA